MDIFVVLNVLFWQKNLGQEKGTEEATNGKGGGFNSSELSDCEMGDIDELLQGKDYPTCPQCIYSLHFLACHQFLYLFVHVAQAVLAVLTQ
jgi:hypothetical protein